MFTVSKTDLLELCGIFGNDLELAFNIIDRDRLIVYRTEKLQRKFIEVAENKETTYKLFPNVNYCMCADFQSRVIDKSEAYTCRHVLAAKLSQFFSTIREQIVADDIFKSLIESIAAD